MDKDILDQIDSAMEYVQSIENTLNVLKTAVVKTLMTNSKNRVKNNGMLDYKDLMKVTTLNQSYVYSEIDRLKKKYNLTYKHRALPVNIVSKEFGVSEDIIFQVTQKNGPAATGPKQNLDQ